MKIFTLAPNEDWIVDRLAKEWNNGNSDIVTNDIQKSDIIWLLADWCHRHIPRHILSSRKILTTVHHIVPEKFGPKERQDFAERDLITSVYHCYNDHTIDFLKKENLTKKPIVLVPYWANQNIWKKTADKYELRKKHGLPLDAYLIGSFQRDTEGHDLKSPKLEKGPDLFVKFVSRDDLSRKVPIHVVLAGWRRQYVVHELEIEGIPYSFFERPPQETLNELYQTLDLYPVTARQEGGPQALLECGLLEVPVVSRSVGIAEQVLPPEAINSNVAMARPAVPDVKRLKMTLPEGFEGYRTMFRSIYEGKLR